MSNYETIANMRKAGKTLQEIGDRYGVSRQAIHQQIERGPRVVGPDQRENQQMVAQAHILDFIIHYRDQYGYPPSTREIMDACHISSTSVTRKHLEALEAAGLIERDARVARGIRVVKDGNNGNS